MTFKGPIGGLIDFAIGGGWGSEVPKENHSRVAVIRGTDIPKVASGDFSSVPFRYESDKKLANRILAPGDVVLETAGGSSANGQFTGRTLLITQEILDKLGPTICASFCKKIVLKKDLVDPLYFYLYMQDLYKSGRVASYDSQSTGISNFQYEAFVNNELLALPKSEIQASVAIVLSSLQNKINVNSQISKTLEDIAQTIFKSWFIDFDPVKAKMAGEKPVGMDAATAVLFPDSMVDSEMGLIPKGWSIGSIGDVSNINGGKMLSRKEFNPEGTFPIFGGAGVMGKTNKSNADGFVITVGRVGAYCGQFFYHRGSAWVNNNASRIIPKDDISGEWMYLFLKSFDIENIKKGAAQPFVSNSDLAKSKLMLPSAEVIQKFTEVVEPIFKQSENAKNQARLLSKLRDTLLPRLISGELQIPDEMLAS